MQWSQYAWNESQPIYRRILELDFLRELMEGRLERRKFLFYIHQDAHYLAAFGKALAGIAARLDAPNHVAAYLSFAADTMTVEKALHQSFLQGEKPDTPLGIEPAPSPTCRLYASSLLATLAVDGVEVAMAATLPCFRVYKDVGDHILEYQTKDNNPYQDWIDTYGGEEYASAVARASAICDERAAAAPPALREEMTRAYLLSTRMEWMFWESAYRMEQWPV